MNNKKTALVVDDEITALTVNAFFLMNCGFKTLIAKTRQEAVEVIDKNPDGIDLLVSDTQLDNGSTGFEVAEHYRTRNPEGQVIGVSAKKKFKEQWEEYHALFIGKPVDNEVLKKLVDSLLGQ